MKTKVILYILILIFTVNSSCHRNRLKINEKELAKEINIQENQKKEAERIAREKELADTLNKGTKGPMYKEDRSVDPANPPVIIDIEGSLDKINEFKLSEVISEIEYVRIEQPPDSAFRKDIQFDYYLTNDYIIAVNRLGILKYSKDGKYLNTIVKNEFTVDGMVITTFIGASYMQGGGTFYNNIKSIGNKLYYTYLNNISYQEYRMEYDCSEMELNQTAKYDPEFPSSIIGKGKIMADYNLGIVNPPASQKNPEVTKDKRNAYVHKGFRTNWIDENTYTKKLSEDDIFAIINKQGDTLSKFALYEKLVNYTKSVGRGTDDGCHYEYKGKNYFRNAYNDTLFNVIPPNRLLPVYVLNLGRYKATRQQGTDPDFDLTGKIIPEEWFETEKYILLTFTKDNYDCPNTRKKKTVKIYHALYSKMNRQFSVIKGDPYDYSPEILENDIDGGLPVWPYHPTRYIIGQNGEVMISFKGNELKDRVKTEQFKLSTAPETKKNELKQLATLVSDTEDILMIVK
jgi:hypothetical protein